MAMLLVTNETMSKIRATFGPLRRGKEYRCPEAPLGRVLILDVRETTRGYLISWA